MNLPRHPGLKRPRYESIQVLRALAALMVVLFHMNALPRGYTGVDLFFVISGYIMGVIGIEETPGRFVYRRFTRVAPLYWIVTLAMCALSFVQGLMRSFAFTGEELAKSLLFIPYFDRTGQIYPLVVQGWTLNYEMLFYLVFALALLAPTPRRTTIIAFAALVLAGLIFTPAQPFAIVATNPLVLEFAAGLALSCWLGKLSVVAGRVLLSIGAVGMAVMMTGLIFPGEGMQRVLVAGLPSMCLLAGALSLERGGRWPALPAAVFLGNISYSLYLTHGLALPVVERAFPGNHLMLVPFGIAASIALATVTFFAFERPSIALFRRFEKRIFPQHAQESFSLEHPDSKGIARR